MFRHPLAIAAAGDITDPIFVFKIPADRLADAALKCLQRTPVEFVLDFARVHRVPAVVGRGGFYQNGEVAHWANGVVRGQPVTPIPNRARHTWGPFFASPPLI